MFDLFSISEIKITYNPKFKASERPKVASSQDAFDLIHLQWKDIHYRESFAILLLNRANKCLGFSFISKGGLSGTVADPKMIFQAALKANASSIILVHNHPSGNIQPSQNDVNLTKTIVNAGKLLELQAIDHLIVSADAYFSFADEGLI
jgi:DNA repair protein RadC